ncbi:hypothetical protein [Planktotalea arctica]|uniref:hypothetical protein n=1 Tax=Planktotalea arctica TaxID=1481893 RepID=UPI000A176E8D|nr:hypothetical protein [Planktotalea arctica]
MSTDTPATPHSKSALLGLVFSMLRRPIEYGLTGAALVGVLYLANQSSILPKVFKGAGFEVEFQERVIQTTADTEQGIKVLRANIKDMRSELAALRAALEINDAPLLARSLATSAPAAPSFQEDADGASKDSLLVKQDQLIQAEGFIWLGTYDPALNAWTDGSVQTPGGGDLPSPDSLSDQVLTLTTTINVRDGYPPNNEAYFRAVRAIGIAETGTRITLLAAPQTYAREEVQQIWAHVDVPMRPYIGFSQSD